MSGDYSRLTFDPKRDYAAMQLQQGRPLTDADWNEQAALVARRIQAGTLDTVGRAVVPRALPYGFRIALSADQLTIERGRMYLDGLLVENHGTGTDTWDPALTETFGSSPTPFRSQPFLPVPPEQPTSGSWVAYLDVWQREVTHLQDHGLVEKALGVDTSTRLQTVWQVKLHQAATSDTAGVNCANALQNDADWARLMAPPASRLTSTTAAVPGEPDPCLIPPGAGYKGLENQLYRVEIHQGGTTGTASFKWSRDNASVETRVARIVDATHVIVDSIGKDGVLRFSDGDWIEFVDEARELSGLPGELRRIRVGNGVDEATRRITLDQALPAAEFPVGVPEAARALRVRRWDQKGKVRRADGTLHADLDAASSNGAILIPVAGTQLLLENGVVVSFALQPDTGRYRVGEWWVFAARSTDASIEELDQAPPRGIHHHYAKLGIWDVAAGTVTDCRHPWPPATTGTDCACTVCVTPQAHASEKPSLQMAIDEITARGGTICLEVGEYALKQPLKIQNAKSLRITGKGEATLLQAATAAILVEESHDIVLESFKAVGGTKGVAISLLNSEQIRIEHVHLESSGAAALGLGGALVDVLIRGNTLQAPVGILGGGGWRPAGGETGVVDLRVENNAFECVQAAVRLGTTVHQLISRFAGNRVVCAKDGFQLTGATVPGFGIDIVGNEFQVGGDAIVAGVDGLRIVDNDLITLKPSGKQRGIVLTKGMTGASLDDAQIVGNRIVGFVTGIAVEVSLGSVAIARNQIAKADFGLLVNAKPAVSVASLSINDNQMSAIEKAAILVSSTVGRVAVCGNQLEIKNNAPGVMIACGEGDCVFSDNHSLQPKAEGKDGVQLTARTLVVASNRILGRGMRMNLQPGPGQKETPLCTVVGNITGGEIFVNWLPLPAHLPMPWASLNVVEYA